MRKLLYLQYAALAVVMALFGLAAFGILMVDFLFPGTFKDWFFFQGGMELNLALLLGFGLQHSLMARQPVKRVLARLMTEEMARSTYVMWSGFTLFALAALWSPMSPPIYNLHGTVWGWVLLAGPLAGGLIVVVTGLQMGGLELLGIGVVQRLLKGEEWRPPAFRKPGLYQYVRHPLYFGMLLIFWITPAMTHDHLFFAEVMTAYLLLGTWFEERDLVNAYGEAYREYQRETPMLLPIPKFWRRSRRD